MAMVGRWAGIRRVVRTTVMASLTGLLACGREMPIEEAAEPATEVAVKSGMAEKPYRMSAEGMERLRTHEAFEPEIYDDGAGNETIGYGHLVLPGENYSGGLTEQQAIELFHEDVARVVNPSLDKITIDLTQNQVDALGSFIYNVGPKAFEKFMLTALNEGRLKEAAAEMMEYVNGKDLDTGERIALRGLIKRRTDEVALFNNPVPQSRPRGAMISGPPPWVSASIRGNEREIA